MTKEKIDPKAFSLWLHHGQSAVRIEIPYTKRGIKGMNVGGKETYLMAIDAFTTQFSNIDELINYIREKALARIKTIPNEEINMRITYNGDYPFNGNLSLIFSDNIELIQFINVNQIKGRFHFLNPYVYNWQKFIFETFKNHPYSAEYRMFMTNLNNPYYASDLLITLAKHKGEILNQEECVIGPLSEYYNIRGNTIANKHLETELKKIYQNKIVPFNERAEQKSQNFRSTIEPVRFVKTSKNEAYNNDQPYQLNLFAENDNHKTR